MMSIRTSPFMYPRMRVPRFVPARARVSYGFGTGDGDDKTRKNKVSELNKLMYMDHRDLSLEEISNTLNIINVKTNAPVVFIDIDAETMELSLLIDVPIHPQAGSTHDDATIEFVNELCAGEKVREELTSFLLIWGRSLVFPVKIPLSVFFHPESHDFL